MNKSQKKKVRQTADGELTPEEVQHLRRCGFTITKSPSKRPSKRPLRRFAAWWETTLVEQFLEDVVFLLKNAALLDIINLVAAITIIISLITWLATERQRRDAEVYQAWQVITAAYDQPGSGGRIEALEFLNSEPRRNPWFWLKWERQSLAGLAVPNAFLFEIELPQADLTEANLQQAILIEADLQRASLRSVNLQQANLWFAVLGGALLRDANLQQANLMNANLQDAILERAILEEADIQDALLASVNLQGASLKIADLNNTVLWKANLQEAILEGANFQRAFLDGVKNLTPKQIKSSCNWEKAIYIGKLNWDKENGFSWVATEPDNTNYIEKLKKDKSSDPKELPDCRRWEK